MNGLWLGQINEMNAWYHTVLIAKSSNIDKLHIVRYKPFDCCIDTDNLKYHTFNNRGFLFKKHIAIFLKGHTVLKKEKIDFIINFNVFPYGLISWILSVWHKVPLVICFIGTDYHFYFKKQPFRFFILEACKKASVIICMGSYMFQGLIDAQVDQKKLKLHPYFVSDKWFVEPYSVSHEFDLITVCVLKELKQVDVLIHAAKLLKDENIVVKICIVGEGREKEGLISLAKNLGVDGQIIFAGSQDQDSVLMLLRKSKIFVQTSRSEGLSLALIEALAAGTVPITTVAGSEKDIIKDGHNGLFVEIGNPVDLAEKIKFLMDGERYRKIRENVDKERQQYRLDNAIKIMETILGQVKMDNHCRPE